MAADEYAGLERFADVDATGEEAMFVEFLERVEQLPDIVARRQRSYELLALATGERVADVGCGLGTAVRELAARGARAIGFDTSAAMLSEARRRSEGVAVEYALADAVDLPLDSTHAEYYDAEGNSLRKAFLQAPLKYSRISSGFTQRRFHPVQKRFKAHLGTDYAAPYGTPILTVGDGVVEKTGWTAGNGNYVKVRHNGVYTTQYLHMRKILVKQGQRVAQGDVIGEVGSTGLASGPHVCFRFWKNGAQVDHRREELPSAEPVAMEHRSEFDRLRDVLRKKLDAADGATAQAHVANF